MIFQQATHGILVIEHNAWIRTELVAHLADAGYQVREASNGFTGLRLARGVVPDLIVLGGALPEVASVQVREELWGDTSTRSVPVIALDTDSRSTSSVITAEVRRVLEARAA
jgi:DNA-binding response OmpR family regulator